MKLKIINWKHYVLAFLYISTTIIFQFSILQIGDSYLYQYQNYVTKGNRQDFKVEDVSIDESNKLKVNFTEQFADYKPMYLQTTCLLGSLKDKDAQINLCSGNQEGMNEIKDIKAEEGSFPNAKNEIMIERSWNNHLAKQYKPQDTLRIDYIDENQRKTMVLTVSGIYESKVSEAIPVFWGNGDIFHDVGKAELKNDFYFLSLATKEISSPTLYYDLTFSTYESSMMYPKGNPADLSDEEKARIKEINQKFMENEAKMKLYSNNESIVNSGNVMKYIGFFILIPLILTLVALQYLQTKLHTHEYRTLRCLGCNKKQLYLQVWKESLYSAIPAIIFGILVGTILNTIVGNFMLDNLIPSSIDFKIIYTWKTYFLAVVLGIVPLVFSTTITMIKLRQKYPLQSMLQKQKKQMKSFHEVLHFPLFSTIFIICIFSIMLFFYMVSINLLLILPKGSGPLKEQISSYEIMPNHVGVSLHETLVNDLKKLEHVNEVYLAENGVMQMLNHKGVFIPHYVYSDELMDAFLKANDIVSDVQNDVIYVLPKVSDKTEITPIHTGGTYPFEIQTLENKISKVDIQVDKVITADFVNLDGIGRLKTDSAVLIFSEKSAKETFGNVSYTNAFFDLSSDFPEDQVRKLSTLLGNEDFTHSGYEDESYDGQMKVVTILIGYFTFIIIFTAMLCFYCVLSCILMTKQKELGVLRAIGLSRKRTFISMSLEVSYMLILSAVFAFITFSTLFSMLTASAQLSGITIIEPSFYNYLWTLTLGVLSCMGILIIMINYQSKRQIIMEIKESEGR